jgi:sensor c-di-GMP phosphodiesterase-like protein
MCIGNIFNNSAEGENEKNALLSSILPEHRTYIIQNNLLTNAIIALKLGLIGTNFIAQFFISDPIMSGPKELNDLLSNESIILLYKKLISTKPIIDISDDNTLELLISKGGIIAIKNGDITQDNLCCPKQDVCADNLRKIALLSLASAHQLAIATEENRKLSKRINKLIERSGKVAEQTSEVAHETETLHQAVMSRSLRNPRS